MNTPVIYLMVGVLFGTTFLAMGIAIGVWLTKRPVHDLASSPPETIGSFSREETQHLLNALRSFATWTSDFAGDFHRYRAQMNDLSVKAANENSFKTKEDVKGLLGQIVVANRELQSRLENAEKKLEQQTHELAGYLNEARTDGLTGLANRRAFDQRIDECYKNWVERKQVFTLALIDIDHFKKINDTYGHPAGDAVLKEVASRLRVQDESCLLVARYGGEEFALLFAAPLNAAAGKMESLRRVIQDKAISAEGQTIQVTISVGVSEITTDDRIAKIIRRSDEALYSAKMSGRNRVFVHTGKLCEVYGNPGTARQTSVAMAHASAAVGSLDADPTKESLQMQLLNRLDELLAEERRK
ncbi:MAG: GGDEF domain-containing protein [Pirellula sp.]|nr:GGDEF domain-containing protein [Pirellula sp.]